MSEGQPGQRGLLMSYVTEPHAVPLAGRASDARLSWTLEHLERIFPGVRGQYEGGTSYAWSEDPWSRGAYPTYGPGQVIDLFPAVRQSEGRLHFAGDHASVWPGWMQGALESANRAARTIDAAPA